MMPQKVRSLMLRYGVAMLAVTVSLLFQWLTSPVLGPYLFMLFLVAVTISAWYGGLGPGLLATGLVVLNATYLLPEPLGHWLPLGDPRNVVRLSLFSGLGIILSILFDSLKSEVSIRQRLLNQLGAERARFHAFMAHSPTISVIKDAQGHYLYVSKLARHQFGMEAEEMVGKTAFDLFPDEIAKGLSAMDATVLAKGKPAEAVEALPSADGTIRRWLVVKFPFQDAAGEALLGAVGVDITERLQAEEQLKQSERRLAEAQRVAHIGSWERDLRTNEVIWSEELYCMFGVAPQEGDLTYEWFLSLVHPDDRQRLHALLDQVVHKRQLLSYEYRIVLPDGRIRFMHDRSDVILDAEGEPVRMIGTCQDVTERRQSEEQLNAARQRVLEAEVAKKRFTREVLRAATNDKLHVVEPDEIPHEGQVVAEISLDDPMNYSLLRQRLKEITQQAGMYPDHANDLVLAMSEATTNAIKHAGGGRAVVRVDPDQVIVRITDKGHGIRPEDLPATVLQAGFSTKISLGMGFTLILETSDQVWLATGSDGTVLQLSSWIHPEQHVRDPLLAILDRFSTPLPVRPLPGPQRA